jgi:hypothetical protein
MMIGKPLSPDMQKPRTVARLDRGLRDALRRQIEIEIGGKKVRWHKAI